MKWTLFGGLAIAVVTVVAVYIPAQLGSALGALALLAWSITESKKEGSSG